MATNREYDDGRIIEVDVSDAVHAGDSVTSNTPLLLGGHIPGVALTDADADDLATVQLGSGVFRLEVSGAVTEIGQAVYMTSAGALNRTTSNDLFGFALDIKAAGASVIRVALAAQSDNVPSS